MLPTLPFGRTGHQSTRLLFGAAALAAVSQEEADRGLGLLLEAGVNHIDTAASYGDAELRIGPWMREHRHRFFLATKTGERTYEAARREIRRSLERLRVDQLDLLQLHNLVKEEEWELAMGPQGALRAAVEAREEGLVRFVGVTGHGTRVASMHLRSLERFDFDSVLLPYNFSMMQDAEYAAQFESLLHLCHKRAVAVQTIKSIARRRWEDGTKPRTTTWYEPLEDQADIDRAVHFALGKPGVFVNSASDLSLLPRMIEAARRYQHAPTEAALRTDAQRLSIAPLFVRGYSGRL
ncbi:MAG TPA: aldo/keto reductase [Deltaproteobacteria bacterium]|jgi:aryl-alcohol dehydrogenase-like predicted oxidoreductase|nr:aldo/keto reductase [Deltaproteobacteria bacterium]